MKIASLDLHRYDFAAYLTFLFYAACSVAVPVILVQLAASLDFPLDKGGMSAGGAIQIGRTVAMVVLLLASGFIAGRFGMRRSLGVSIIVMALGIFLCAVSPVYAFLFIALLVAGSGEGVIEGIATPFVQKLHEQDTGQYMNFTHGFWSFGVMFTVIAAGYAVMCGVSWRIILSAIAVMSLIPAVMLLMPETRGHEFPEVKRRVSVMRVWMQIRSILSVRRFWVFFFAIFLSGGAEFCLTFWLASFMQISISGSAMLGGIATGIFAGGMALGRSLGGILVPSGKLPHLLLYSSLAGVLSGFAVPFLTPENFAGHRVMLLALLFATLFLIGLATAVLWPTIQTYSVERLPKGLDSTMIFILLSCAGVPGCGTFTLLMGMAGILSGAVCARSENRFKQFVKKDVQTDYDF